MKFSEECACTDECIIPTLNILKKPEIDLINQNSNTVTYEKRDVIFKQQTRTSHIMYLKKGLVKIYKEGRNNRNIILKISKPNNYLGLISSSPCSSAITARAIVSTCLPNSKTALAASRSTSIPSYSVLVCKRSRIFRIALAGILTGTSLLVTERCFEPVHKSIVSS